uniref:LITAF domain-containing protein n=1 Tax=Strongyloides stercoralis TaxID=6248 RepID=A0A0K0DWL1_STRER
MISSNDKIFSSDNIKKKNDKEDDIMLKKRSMILYCNTCKKLVYSVPSCETYNDIKNESLKINIKFPHLYPAIPCIYYLQLMKNNNNCLNVTHKCPICKNVLESFQK